MTSSRYRSRPDRLTRRDVAELRAEKIRQLAAADRDRAYRIMRTEINVSPARRAEIVSEALEAQIRVDLTFGLTSATREEIDCVIEQYRPLLLTVGRM